MSKLIYLVIFYLIYSLTELALLFLLVAQTLLNIFSDGPSDSLKRFGGSLGIYVKQISEYLSYASDKKPYPFSDWPDAPVEDKELKEIKP